jgi:hypothetical protein
LKLVCGSGRQHPVGKFGSAGRGAARASAGAGGRPLILVCERRGAVAVPRTDTMSRLDGAPGGLLVRPKGPCGRLGTGLFKDPHAFREPGRCRANPGPLSKLRTYVGAHLSRTLEPDLPCSKGGGPGECTGD